MQRPVGVDGSGALEVGPKHDLGFRRAEQACLCTGAEAVVVDFGGELLCTFQGVAQGGFAALVARKGQVGAGGAQGAVDGGVNDLVESLFQRGGELQAHAVAQGIEGTPLGVVRRSVFRAQFVFNALQGAGLAGGVEHLLEGVARTGEEEHTVFVLLLGPPGLPVGRDGQLVGLTAGAHDDQSGFFQLDLHFIWWWQHFDDLVTVAQ